MDFDYNTIKYLVFILSLLILGYAIFLIYTDLTTVRGEFIKMKNKLSDTTNSLEELQKHIEYVENDSDTEISNDEEHNTLHSILNNNFFTQSNDPEQQQDTSNINSFSLNIPLFSQKTETPNLASIEEISESGENEEEEIKFEKTLKQCQNILVSGKNKGNQCTKYAVEDSDFCSKHNKNK